MQTHIPTRPNGTVLQAVPVQNKGGKMVVAITCSKCRQQFTGGDRPYAPIDVIMRHFSEKGWRIAARATTAMCPACQRENSAAPPPEAAAISAEFERQRLAEEAKIAATNAASPAPAAVVQSDVQRAKAIIDSIELSPRGLRGKHWHAHPKQVAELMAIASAKPPRERATFLGLDVGCPAFASAWYQFRRGLVADGSAAWPELRAELDRLKVEWIREPKPRVAVKRESKPMITTTPQNTATIDAERARVQVVRLLDAHFSIQDGATVGQYAEGWSDERVSKESGLALDLVKRTRTLVYGEIIDPHRAKIEAALAALAEEAKAARAMLADLDSKIAGMTRQVADLKRW